MQVTRESFPAVFPKFVELLQSCEFFAFDEEMTGINMADLPECVTDSPEESYRCKRAVASRYNIIQVGICLFHKDDDGKDGEKGSVQRYVARPFNFVLFPRQNEDTHGEELGKDVVLSPSSLSFLRRHGMDFQSWVYRGVGYCDAAQEDKFFQRQKEKYQTEEVSVVAERERLQEGIQGVDLMTVDERSWFEDALLLARTLSERAKDALRRARTARCGDAGEPPSSSALEVAAMVDLLQSGGREIFLPPQRSRNAREQLERVVAREFRGELLLTFGRRGGGGSVYNGTLRVVFPEEFVRLEEKRRSEREREEMDVLGFRLVFKALVASRKPCVGHNCFADLLFLLASFDRSLPESLTALKVRILELFPVVFDTRYIVNRQDFFPSGRFASRHLNGYFEEYGFHSANVHVTLPLGFQMYDPLTTFSRGYGSGGGGPPLHEAGYDAMLTGILLLNLLAEIGSCKVSNAPERLVNRVALFRSLYALNLESLDGGDEFLPFGGNGGGECGSGSIGVLDLRHEKKVKGHHIDSCFLSLPLRGVVLHSVNETRTLAILPLQPPCSISIANGGSTATAIRRSDVGLGSLSSALAEADVSRLATLLTSRFPQYFEATPYHQAAAKACCAARSGGVFRATPSALMRTLIRFLL